MLFVIALLGLGLEGCGLFGDGGTGAGVNGPGSDGVPIAAIYVQEDEADGLAWGDLLVELGISAQVIWSADASQWDVSGANLLLIGPDVDDIPNDIAAGLVALGVPILGMGGGGISFYQAAGVTDLSFSVPSATSSVVVGAPEHPAFRADRWAQDEEIVVTTQPVTGWGVNDTTPDVLLWDAEFGSQDFGLLLGVGHTYHWGLGDDGQGAALLTAEGEELVQSAMAWLVGVDPPEPSSITGE